MQKRQWYALVGMFSVFMLVTTILGWFALLQLHDLSVSLLFGYFGILWLISTITCFICGSLEKEKA
jgi:hypothetical protein